MFARRDLWRRGARAQSEALRLLGGRGLASAPPSLPPFDHQPRPYQGMLADDVLAKRKKFLGPSLFYYYQKPVTTLPNIDIYLLGNRVALVNQISVSPNRTPGYSF